jgi:hypothetical protein
MPFDEERKLCENFADANAKCATFHQCADCSHEMPYNKDRKKCGKSKCTGKKFTDPYTALMKFHQCAACSHEMAYKKGRKKCGESDCKGKKFTDPYTKTGFTEARLLHDTPFFHNKKLVEQYTDLVGDDGVLVNKRMRNWIAGYITTYKQRRVD